MVNKARDGTAARFARRQMVNEGGVKSHRTLHLVLLNRLLACSCNRQIACDMRGPTTPHTLLALRHPYYFLQYYCRPLDSRSSLVVYHKYIQWQKRRIRKLLLHELLQHLLVLCELHRELVGFVLCCQSPRLQSLCLFVQFLLFIDRRDLALRL